ncbi:hypothetical protein AB1Y20_014036 [Prymnesium parvum]|uniref:CHK kinase-like domain-containing protein n=1 Tax=Prymnesium parvum TaxID=97485 RepID=A0AB34IGT8_PRYPA
MAEADEPIGPQWLRLHACDGLTAAEWAQLGGASLSLAPTPSDGLNSSLSSLQIGSLRCILKSPPRHAPSRDAAELQRWYEREARFYRELAPAVPRCLALPRCLAASYSPDGRSFALLLEDLRHASPPWEAVDEGAAAAAAALRALGSLHARFLGSDALHAAEEAWLPLTPVRRELIGVAEACFAAAWPAVRVAYAGELGGGAAAAGELCRHYGGALRRLAAPPRTLVHGDFRAENLRVRRGGGGGALEVAAFDWQFVSAARGAYDLAYFLALALPAGTRRAHEAALRREYLAPLRAAGGGGAAAVEAALSRDLRDGALAAFCSFVIGAAAAPDEAGARATHARGLQRLAGALLDWSDAAPGLGVRPSPCQVAPVLMQSLDAVSREAEGKKQAKASRSSTTTEVKKRHKEREYEIDDLKKMTAQVLSGEMPSARAAALAAGLPHAERSLNRYLKRVRENTSLQCASHADTKIAQLQHVSELEFAEKGNPDICGRRLFSEDELGQGGGTQGGKGKGGGWQSGGTQGGGWQVSYSQSEGWQAGGEQMMGGTGKGGAWQGAEGGAWQGGGWQDDSAQGGGWQVSYEQSGGWQAGGELSGEGKGGGWQGGGAQQGGGWHGACMQGGGWQTHDGGAQGGKGKGGAWQGGGAQGRGWQGNSGLLQQDWPPSQHHQWPPSQTQAQKWPQWSQAQLSHAGLLGSNVHECWHQGSRQQGGSHLSLAKLELSKRQELAGLKAAQALDPTPVRAQMIAELQVELTFMM